MRSLLYSLLLVATSLPILVYGQGKVYSPLVNIPGNGANGFEEYISFLYGASISVAALLAVVKIIIAGAKYMMSDVIPAKGEALSDIQGAILGLLLILGAVIILEFINPQLIKRDIKFEPIAKRADINARNSSVNADGTPKVGIVVPDKQLSTYFDTDIGAFDTLSGNMMSFDIDGYCQNQIATGALTGGSKQYLYDACINSTAPGRVADYCRDNWGNFETTKTSATCQLPTARKWMSDGEFKTAFEAYKASLPANDYAGKEATTMSLEVEKLLCKKWGGEHKDFTGWSNGCAKY